MSKSESSFFPAFFFTWREAKKWRLTKSSRKKNNVTCHLDYLLQTKAFFLPLKIDNWGWEKQTNEKTHVFCEDWSTWNSTIWTMSKFVFSANLPFEALKKGKKRPKTSFENFCFEGWNPWNLTRNGVKKKSSYMLTFCSFQTKAFFCTRALAFVGKDRQAKKLTSFSCFFSLLKGVTL